MSPAVTFKTVYDAGQQGYTTWTFGAVLVMFACFLGWQLFAETREGKYDLRIYRDVVRRNKGIRIYCFGVIFVSVLAIITLPGSYYAYKRVQEDMKYHRYQVIEGYIYSFYETPKGDKFWINGKYFYCYTNVVSTGFHQCAASGGPLRNGLYVRLAYTRDDILRVEIAQ